MYYRHQFLLISFLLLQGCNQGKELVSAVISVATKSDNQKSAENGCWDAAMNAESQRTKGLKALSSGPIETTKIDDNHFLVKVSYKKITLDDPGQKSNNVCMYGNTTCEILNNSITAVKPYDSFCDSLPSAPGAPPTSGNDSLEGQRIDDVIKHIETRYPELNENSPRYNQQLVDQVLSRQKFLFKQGVSASSALWQAATEFAH